MHDLSDETMEMLRGLLKEDVPHPMPVPAAPRLPGQPGYSHSTFSLSSREWGVDEAEASKLRQERHRHDIMKEQIMKEHVLAERGRYHAKRKADHEAQAEEEALNREKLLLGRLQEEEEEEEEDADDIEEPYYFSATKRKRVALRVRWSVGSAG